MVVLLFSDTISKRNNRQLYLLTCRKCCLLLVGLSAMYLYEQMQYLIPQCIAYPRVEEICLQTDVSSPQNKTSY